MTSPSGPSPTTTLSITRGGDCSRSMTLTVSIWPSAEPALPLSAVSAILPSGVTSTLYGHGPTIMSYLPYVTFSPATARTAILWPGNLAESARLTSGVKTTWATCSPIATVSISSTLLPAMRSTLIELSGRLAISVFFFQAEDGIRDLYVTGVQTCALPIYPVGGGRAAIDPPLPGRLVGPRSGIPRGVRARRHRGSDELPRRAGGDRAAARMRSEERRVGKECRSRVTPYLQTKKRYKPRSAG